LGQAKFTGNRVISHQHVVERSRARGTEIHRARHAILINPLIRGTESRPIQPLSLPSLPIAWLSRVIEYTMSLSSNCFILFFYFAHRDC